MNNTLIKGLAVLELLSRSGKPLSLTQIAQQLGLMKSNVHRLLQGLQDTSFVLRDDATGTYTPAIKLWELGSATLAQLDLRRYAERQMEALMRRTGESVHLSVLDGHEVVYVHRVDCPNPVRAFPQVGSRAPAHCAATGKVQMAFARQSFLDGMAGALVRYTPRTLAEPDAFFKEMAKVRMQGFAINRGEWRGGVCGIAAPVMDARGAVIAGVGISGPAGRFRRSVMADWTEAVIATCNQISDALGRGTASGSALARLRFGGL